MINLKKDIPIIMSYLQVAGGSYMLYFHFL